MLLKLVLPVRDSRQRADNQRRAALRLDAATPRVVGLLALGQALLLRFLLRGYAAVLRRHAPDRARELRAVVVVCVVANWRSRSAFQRSIRESMRRFQSVRDEGDAGDRLAKTHLRKNMSVEYWQY